SGTHHPSASHPGRNHDGGRRGDARSCYSHYTKTVECKDRQWSPCRHMKIEEWGLIDYTSAAERQMALVDEVAAGGEERIIFCTHPPVVTLGRGTLKEDVGGWSGATVETSRGGRATYH